MVRIPPALVMQVVGTFAWLLLGAMARPGAAQEPGPAAAAPSFADVVSSRGNRPATGPAGRPVNLERSHRRLPVQSGDPGIDLRPARSGHLAAVAVLDALQRRLARVLGAIAQRFGRRARQGWINAADGNMYRLWFFTFGQAFNQGPKGNAYLGAYTLYTPLSRRLLLITNIPFVLRNNAGSGLPTINPSGLTAAVEGPHDIRRHLVHAPRLAARDAGLLAHGRDRGAGPDRQPAPRGEDRPDPGLQLLEQFRGPLGDPGRDR